MGDGRSEVDRLLERAGLRPDIARHAAKRLKDKDQETTELKAREDINVFAKMMLDVEPARHHRLLNDALMKVERGEIQRLAIFMPPGSAKALALDTPIPTPSGWTTMGDLQVGDEVFGDDGRPCKVTWKSDVWAQRPVFRVSTDCGDEIIADRDHEWRVRLCGKRPVFKIKETWQIAGKRAKRAMVERARPLDLPDADLPIHPYFLGLWLGDGNSDGPTITSNVEDQEHLRRLLHNIGYATKDTSHPTRYRVNGVRASFVSLGLLRDPQHATFGRKHIPSIYMRSSVEQRMWLLNGLIDSDGHVSTNGEVCFSNTNIELAHGVQELVRSLGRKAGLTESRAMLRGKDCGPVYRVHFYCAGAATLPRKRSRCRDQARTPNTYINAVECGVADTVCIEVDSKSHLFLAGASMTPTHNSTYSSWLFPAWYLGRNPTKNVIGTSHTDDFSTLWGRRCRNLLTNPKWPFPNVQLADDAKGAQSWATTLGGTYFGVGVGGAVTGRRADLALIDDPVKSREQADSETARNRCWEWFLADLHTRLKPMAALILIMTRWHEDDLAGRILGPKFKAQSGPWTATDGRMWHVICLPQFAVENDPLGRAVGETLWPEWFSKEHMEMERITQGPRNWNALYQQRPTADAGGYFKRDELRFYEEAPRLESLRIYGASDYGETGDGDYTVHGVVGLDREDNIYVLDWFRDKVNTLHGVEQFYRLVGMWNPVQWAEDKAKVERSIKPFVDKRGEELGLYVKREQYSVIQGGKEMRAASIRGRISQGKLFLPHRGPWVSDLIDEMMQFPAGRHDDQIDVLSLIGRMLTIMRPKVVDMHQWNVLRGHESKKSRRAYYR